MNHFILKYVQIHNIFTLSNTNRFYRRMMTNLFFTFSFKTLVQVNTSLEFVQTYDNTFFNTYSVNISEQFNVFNELLKYVLIYYLTTLHIKKKIDKHNINLYIISLFDRCNYNTYSTCLKDKISFIRDLTGQRTFLESCF